MTIHQKTTTLTLREKKRRKERITMLTAYDFPTARALDQAGVDVALVGDSLGMVVLGYSNTLPVTMEDMLHHCRAVARGISSALVVADMPFMSYQACVEEAIRNAGRFLQEAGADSVKLEGGRERAATIRAIVAAGIPVMGHLGLTPQSIHQIGGWKSQGKSMEGAIRLLEDARLLEECGCYAIVLESIPGRLAALITDRLSIPTIGIGAGAGCGGQVLVSHDLLGLHAGISPGFARKYAELYREMVRAFEDYRKDVLQGSFPADEHTCGMDDGVYRDLVNFLARAENEPSESE